MSTHTKESILFKGLIILGLTILLLIPTYLINNLIVERMARQGEAFTEVSSKWAETQTVTGPVVSIPYTEILKEGNGAIHPVRKYIHILPDQLNINGTVIPEKRSRGIFDIVVYSSKLSFSGSFSDLAKTNPGVPPENILYNEAFVSVGISDLRGIEENVLLNWGKDSSSFNSGIETNDILKTGINTPVRITNDSLSTKVDFSFNINLKGSQFIYFTPIGKETNVDINSNWDSPSFDGAFLPDKRDVNSAGFTANWKILHLNRSYPQSWLGDNYSVDKSVFGINLLLPMDNYTKTDRSIKYAILFIALTFLIFFFVELLNNKSVHPLQYILIGFALCLFYVLLLSISEHINYNIAYLIASLMTIGLIWWYAASILGDRKLAGLVGGNLVILYGFIFTIIQVEDYALLMGSIGLFIILALVMYYSRKIDWGGLLKQ